MDQEEYGYSYTFRLCFGICGVLLFGSLLSGIGIFFIVQYSEDIMTIVIGIIFIIFGLWLHYMGCCGLCAAYRELKKNNKVNRS